MKSSPNMATSSECLRLALPLMATYKVPISPPNYAVWYEYVSGQNAALSEAIDGMIAKAQPIDEETTRQLFRQYVDPTDTSRVESAQEAMRVLMDAISQSLDTASGEVSRYEESLRACSAQVTPDMSVDQVRAIVGQLTASTRQMNDGNAELTQHLEDSRRETAVLREELEKARTEAKTDALTGLTNRKAFAACYQDQIDACPGDVPRHCLLMADIDKFKSINDTYGHLLGDRVIKAVAQVLRNLTKGKDLAARFGGEEFVVLLPGTDLRGGLAVAESIRRAVEGGRIVKPATGEEIRRVTISIGITDVVRGEPLDTAIARADQALYRAKEAGRNRVEVNAMAQPRVIAAVG